VTTAPDHLPSDLAAAHAMIMAERTRGAVAKIRSRRAKV
jgi:hypothetical protein